jgi:hypothetical protein
MNILVIATFITQVCTGIIPMDYSSFPNFTQQWYSVGKYTKDATKVAMAVTPLFDIRGIAAGEVSFIELANGAVPIVCVPVVSHTTPKDLEQLQQRLAQ